MAGDNFCLLVLSNCVWYKDRYSGCLFCLLQVDGGEVNEHSFLLLSREDSTMVGERGGGGVVEGRGEKK